MSFKSEHERSCLILSPRRESSRPYTPGYASLYRHIITRSSGLYAVNPSQARWDDSKETYLRRISLAVKTRALSAVVFARGGVPVCVRVRDRVGKTQSDLTFERDTLLLRVL